MDSETIRQIEKSRLKKRAAQLLDVAGIRRQYLSHARSILKFAENEQQIVEVIDSLQRNCSRWFY